MSLDNSTMQHPLPGDLQARVENALNLITSLEAEEMRLRKLIGSNTQKINDLHEEFKSTESRLKALKDQIPQLEDEIKISKDIVNELENQKRNYANDIEKSKDELDALKTDIAEREIKITNREQALEVEEKEFQKRQAVHNEAEIAHEKKVRKLEEALK